MQVVGLTRKNLEISDIDHDLLNLRHFFDLIACVFSEQNFLFHLSYRHGSEGLVLHDEVTLGSQSLITSGLVVK